MTATFFASPRAIVYDCRRRHSRRPEACCWWRRRPRWIWSQEENNSPASEGFDIDLRLRFERFGRPQPITGLHFWISSPAANSISAAQPTSKTFFGHHFFNSSPMEAISAPLRPHDVILATWHRQDVIGRLETSTAAEDCAGGFPHTLCFCFFVFLPACIANDSSTVMRTCLFGGGG